MKFLKHAFSICLLPLFLITNYFRAYNRCFYVTTLEEIPENQIRCPVKIASRANIFRIGPDIAAVETLAFAAR